MMTKILISSMKENSQSSGSADSACSLITENTVKYCDGNRCLGEV
jgi:hypothetical protein